MAVRVTVVGQYDGRSIAAAQRDVDRLRKAYLAQAGPLARLGNTIRSNLVPALGLAAAAAGALAVKFAVDGVKAAMEEEAAVTRLSQALSNVGQAFALPQVETFIDDLQRATGVADSELRPALQRLISATGDAAEAQDLLKVALDVSAGTGRSLESVTLALSKAATGQASSLRRLGVPLSDAAIKSGDLALITEELSDAFGGQAAAQAKTFEGQLRRLGVAFSEVQESFGKGFLSGLQDTNSETDDLMDSVKALEPVMFNLGEQVGTLARALADLEANTGSVSAVLKGLLDITGPTLDALLTLYRVVADGENPLTAAKEQFFGISDGAENAAEGTGAYWNEVLRATGVTKDILSPTEEAIALLEEEADAAEKAAAEFDKLSNAISRTGAVTAYQASLDELRKTLKETKGETSVFNDKGRESIDAYTELAERAGVYIDGLDSQAQQAVAATETLAILESQLGDTQMDPATQAALLGPFQALIDDLRESGLDVDALQTKLDKIKSKTITVTVNTTTYGRPPGVSDKEWYGAVGGMVPKFYAGGGPARGSDTIPAMLAPGEFIIRRQSVKQFGAAFFSQLNRGINPTASFGAPGPNGAQPGGGARLQIGTINVAAAPGEKAEETVPRALRRLAFLAGV